MHFNTIGQNSNLQALASKRNVNFLWMLIETRPRYLMDWQQEPETNQDYFWMYKVKRRLKSAELS